MKKLAAILCLSALTTGAFAQGFVNFFNSSSTLVSQGAAGAGQAISGAAGGWYFALLTSPVGANTFTFAGAYGTNQASAGRFNGGVSVPISGWAAGTARDFIVVGWSSVEGVTFKPAWVTATGTIVPGAFGSQGFGGVSTLGTGQAGGVTASGSTLPNLNIFGGATGIQSGFNLAPVGVVPEPSSMALAGLGAAALLIFRRRK